MSELIRFGVSIDKALLGKFDKLIKDRKYSNRSEAFRDLIRKDLVVQEWTAGKEVAGAITLIYDHHKSDLVNKLIEVQHDKDFSQLVICSQHIHIDHHNCLEIITVKGSPKKIRMLSDKLKATKGVKHGDLTMTTTGKDMR